MFCLEHQAPAPVEPQSKLAGSVSGERVRMSSYQVGHAGRGQKIREPSAQLSRAGLAKLLLL